MFQECHRPQKNTCLFLFRNTLLFCFCFFVFFSFFGFVCTSLFHSLQNRTSPTKARALPSNKASGGLIGADNLVDGLLEDQPGCMCVCVFVRASHTK